MEQRAELVEPELEGRRDPEVRAGTPQAPEELGLLRRARPDQAAIRRDELDRLKIVDRQAEVALEAADAAAERQPGHPGVTDHPDRADETVCLGGDIELAEQRAAVRPSGAPLRVDGHTAELGEVDHEPAVGGRVPGGAVAPGSDGDLEVTLPSEADGCRDVLHVLRADEDGRSPVEHRVPDPARVVVSIVVRSDDLAPERLTQAIHVFALEPRERFGHGSQPPPPVRASSSSGPYPYRGTRGDRRRHAIVGHGLARRRARPTWR